MTQTIPQSALDAWVRGFADLVAENKDYLTELDSAIGDADHGANMHRGMTAAVAAIDETNPTTAKALFSKVGMTLVSKVGGASGPIFGTLFLRMGAAMGAAEEVALGDLAPALRAGLDGVVARGKAELGDKTMVDALSPAVEAVEAAVAVGASVDEAMSRALAAAEAGRDATTPMLARKGRASYLGERSVGHQDPGATTVALLLAAAAKAMS